MNEAKLGFNRFCGPAALSVITGLSTDETAYAISLVNGQHKVKGVTVPDLVSAGKHLGIKSTILEAASGRSIYFVASFMLSRMEGTFIIATKTHYVVVESKGGSISLCDNHTKTPIKLENSSRLSDKVETLIKVEYTPIEKPKPEPPAVEVLREFSVERVANQVSVYRKTTLSNGKSEITRIAAFSGLTSTELRLIGEGIIKNV